jgi:hypothetical protein
MKRLASRFAGYTVAEFIVAVCVILLVIMLLPQWMNHGPRIGSRQSTCSNNLKNLALAVISYEASRNVFPGYRQDVDQTAEISPNDDRSWMFVILPQLDNRAMYDKIRQGALANEDINTNLDLFICPSAPPEHTMTAANCYVANTGLLDGVADSSRPADFAANGVFHNRAAPTSPDVRIETVSAAYISAGDGVSTTALLSENADASRWSGGPLMYSAGFIPSERWLGFTWHEADGQPGNAALAVPLEPLAINVRSGESHRNPQSGARGFARPSSHHPDVVLMAFCDGRVRKVSDQISYRVYQALMTPRGRDAAYTSNAKPLPTGHAASQIISQEDIQ